MTGHAVRSATIDPGDQVPPSAAPITDNVTVHGLSFSATGPARLSVVWPEPPSDPLRVQIDGDAFSVFPLDVSTRYPVILDSPPVVVSTHADGRDFWTAIKETRARATLSVLQQIDSEPEASYDAAARRGRQLSCPTWLGLSRDIRTFGFNLRGVGAESLTELAWDWIAPQWHGEPVILPEAGDQPVRYLFMLGRGVGPGHHVVRSLNRGRLPILEACVTDGDVRYDVTATVGLERSDVAATTNRGTHYLRADGHSVGHMFTREQQRSFELLERDAVTREESALFMRVVATNNGDVPRYAFFKLPGPASPGSPHRLEWRHLSDQGFSQYDHDRVFCVASLDGNPMPHEETAVLLQPNHSAEVDIRIPHQPVDAERAGRLRERSFSSVLAGCRSYWNEKLASSGSIQVPEQRITEMSAAGLLHLDLVAYGEEPRGTLAPTVGVYSPIGSESAPIIQYFDSMGRHDLAERSLQYFLDKQHDDGLIQNFGGYMLETQATLWSLGEHFRYTKDHSWLVRSLPHVEAAVEYIRRHLNEQRANPDNPYNLLLGKTADPEDPFASFMLNGYTYLGLSRAAEMARNVDEAKAATWSSDAKDLKTSIVTAFREAVGNSPVVPLGDGRWVRTAPPWLGPRGPLALGRRGESRFTHGTFTTRDSLLGPLWLLLQEVLDPAEPLSSDLLAYHTELFHDDNAAFSQPYYSPHPLIHLRRREAKRFLRAYYTMVASLADPETYTFWEHYFHASPHKTHEEAWFLMQTRWMLYLEDGDRLRLFPGTPRAWLAPEKQLRLRNVGTYFGALSAAATVSADGNQMTVRLDMDPARLPASIEIRLPHPTGRRASSTSEGEYDADLEAVLIQTVSDHMELNVTF